MSYFSSSTDRFSGKKTSPGGQIKPVKYEHLKKKFQQLSSMVYQHTKDDQEIEAKNKLYLHMSSIKKHNQTLPQNAKQPRGDRASHLYLSFAHSDAPQYLVHKPKPSRLGPGWYRKSLIQQKKLKQQTDFSIRGKNEFQRSLKEIVRKGSLDSTHQRSLCSLSNQSTVRTFSRRQYSLLNISLSNVKDSDDFLFRTRKQSSITSNGIHSERKKLGMTISDYSQTARQANGFHRELNSESVNQIPSGQIFFNTQDLSNMKNNNNNTITIQKDNDNQDLDCDATQEELDEMV